MKRELTVKKYKPSADCVRINELARSALGGAADAKRRINLAADDAMKCGELLCSEKSKVTKEMGRGFWASYFEINHGKVFTIRTAQRWMALHEVSRIESDNVVSRKRSKLETSETGNRLRAEMVALEIFPKKVNAAVEGEGPQPVRNSSFLVIGNRFKAWHANWKKVNGDTQPTEAQLEILRKDVAGLLEFLQVYPSERTQQ